MVNLNYVKSIDVLFVTKTKLNVKFVKLVIPEWYFLIKLLKEEIPTQLKNMKDV